jgi:hypothetical protein
MLSLSADAETLKGDNRNRNRNETNAIGEKADARRGALKQKHIINVTVEAALLMLAFRDFFVWWSMARILRVDVILNEAFDVAVAGPLTFQDPQYRDR